MYARFIRWASDRVGENGVIAFVVNRSFIDSRTFDGFRKVVAEEFGEIYIVDLGGDVRANPKLSGTRNNVFGIQTGVAIVYFVKQGSQKDKADVYYVRRPEMETAKEKLQWIDDTDFEQMPFKHIAPNKHHSWANQAENEWSNLLPTANSKTKNANNDSKFDAMFKLYTNGVVSARDEWVFDFDENALVEKSQFFIQTYNAQVEDLQNLIDEINRPTSQLNRSDLDNSLDYTIKWSANLKNSVLKEEIFQFSNELVIPFSYRPFVKNFYYAEKGMSDRLTANHYEIFGRDLKGVNRVIAINVGKKPFNILSSNHLVDFHFNGDTQMLPLYRYDKHGNRLDNITDWGLKKFREHYGDDSISRENIFHYTYGVLHDPAYRKKYELNLKREFPHIPFYDDFAQWAAWGASLMDLHLNYERQEPYDLMRADTAGVKNPKAKLKADKEAGQIVLDTQTVLSNVPPEAWEYRLGNRSALEWVLDRYKEKKPKDPTIREKFNTYRFADYKEEVIDLLKRVCTVSVETVNIVREMARVGGE